MVSGEGTTLMTVKVALGTRVELREVVERHRELRRALAGSAQWDVRGLSRSETAVVRAGWRREVARLRDAGEVLDTVDALAVFGVRREVEVRGGAGCGRRLARRLLGWGGGRGPGWGLSGGCVVSSSGWVGVAGAGRLLVGVR
ncbi:hypothetical protein SHKM778_95240 (plasmid) [Streptomyces sp. KM77-8]|uniref:Uncharacterized protein n=1 Tax=Streptomyces haneummycinicus TaxID=3074435 RepID=A0AAT9I091_9ACTN